jgi:transaldolase
MSLTIKSFQDLSIKLFADGADKNTMIKMASLDYISGLTTNPTLMKKAGIKNYKDFCVDILAAISEKPISFEVFSDDFEEMRRQALEIAGWGKNVYVKIPITNTKNESSGPLLRDLTNNGVKVNVTAITTLGQVRHIVGYMNRDVASYISIFAGRVADTGVDPLPTMRGALDLISDRLPLCELIWASPRELFNVIQANEIGCHIITATNDVLNKLQIIGKDLEEYSLDTVKMFSDDAIVAGYKL